MSNKRRDWGATDPLRPSGKEKYFKVGNQEQDKGEKRKRRREEGNGIGSC